MLTEVRGNGGDARHVSWEGRVEGVCVLTSCVHCTLYSVETFTIVSAIRICHGFGSSLWVVIVFHCSFFINLFNCFVSLVPLDAIFML